MKKTSTLNKLHNLKVVGGGVPMRGIKYTTLSQGSDELKVQNNQQWFNSALQLLPGPDSNHRSRCHSLQSGISIAISTSTYLYTPESIHPSTPDSDLPPDVRGLLFSSQHIRFRSGQRPLELR